MAKDNANIDFKLKKKIDQTKLCLLEDIKHNDLINQ